MNGAKLYEFMGKIVTYVGGAWMSRYSRRRASLGSAARRTLFNLILEARK